jgi:hypothetical protein
MGYHPVNLAVRFLFEIAALIALGLMGWQYGSGIYRYVFAIGIPLSAAICWATFAVPDDPSRSGKAIVRVPGLFRLFLESVFFVSAIWSFFITGATIVGWVYMTVVLIHYLVSYDRVVWLIRQ